MPEAKSLHKNAAALPTSSMVTLRRKAACFSLKPIILSKSAIPEAASVLIGPAETAFTRMPFGPKLCAI